MKLKLEDQNQDWRPNTHLTSDLRTKFTEVLQRQSALLYSFQHNMFCTNVLSISGFSISAHGGLLAGSSPSLRPRACVKKRVVFADSKGLSLTSVHLFSIREEKLQQEEKLSSLRLKCLQARGHRGHRLYVDFPQQDLQVFQQRMLSRPVLLESCWVSERALLGEVRVHNLSFEKEVQVRVTFNSWRTQQDVCCVFLSRRYGKPDTDSFSFHITLPEHLNTEEHIEFCVKFLPQGYSEPLWDNNNGKNYSIKVCD